MKNLFQSKIYKKAMKCYCVSCRKNTANKNSSVRRTKQNRSIPLPNCAIYGKKKSRFIQNKGASRLKLH